MKTKILHIALITSLMMSCQSQKSWKTDIYETSASGNQLTKIDAVKPVENSIKIKLNPEQKFQKITGFGGAFTESSAYLLNQLSKANREKVLQLYFGEDGANYSLTRTTIASCDFSLKNYTYAPVADDKELKHFSVKEDMDDLIPMIKEAQKISKNGFKILASPWTSPPWMKDNNAWINGKLLPKYNETFALYFSKYLTEYKKLGIPIWGITVVNEPHGNGGNWESMLFTPKEMTDFVENFLGPKLEKDGYGNVKIFGYDQNRAELKNWVDEMYRSEKSSKYFAGTAIHWYESTFKIFEDELQYAHQKNPSKHLIQTEACIDGDIPKWKDDSWYWSAEATDWGFDWAKEEEKYLHPKYVPVFRYAGDIIGCLNNQVDGWIDWNMVLDKNGGPNWFKNWCGAPILVDPEKDEVYVTPLYYTMAHFSKFIRPDAVRIGFENPDKELQVTAAKNPDGSFAVVVFNPSEQAKNIEISVENQKIPIQISAKALQTVHLTF